MWVIYLYIINKIEEVCYVQIGKSFSLLRLRTYKKLEPPL